MRLIGVNHSGFHTDNLVLTEVDEDCQYRGLIPIDSLSECTASILFIKTYYPGVTTDISENKYEETSGYPKGCYYYVKRGTVWFNTALFGSSNPKARAVCKQVEGSNLLKNDILLCNYYC